jgi:hypothetical protein
LRDKNKENKKKYGVNPRERANVRIKGEN